MRFLHRVHNPERPRHFITKVEHQLQALVAKVIVVAVDLPVVALEAAALQVKVIAAEVVAPVVVPVLAPVQALAQALDQTTITKPVGYTTLNLSSSLACLQLVLQ